MEGILKTEDGSWYVEYLEQQTSSPLSTGTPSKFAIRADNIEKILSGEWEAVEGRSVRFELTSLPLPPYYEVDLNSRDMRKNPTSSITATPMKKKEIRIRYRYYVYFSGSSKKIICDEVYESSSVYYFYKHIPLEKPVIEHGAFGMSHERTYDREVVAQFPIINTAIYDIEKFEEEI